MSEARETYFWAVSHPMLWIFLCLTATFFLVQWLVNPRPEDSDQSRSFDTTGWMRRHYVAIVFALGGTAIVAAIYFYVAEVGIAVARLVDRLRVGAAGDLTPEEAKNLAYGIAVLLGALVAAATIPFTLLRTWINERSTTAQEQGLITDRINKAVEGLGSEKESVRIGALHGLYTLGRDERVFPGQVSGIMASHIRMIARSRETEPFPDPIPEVKQGCLSRAGSNASAFDFHVRNRTHLSEWKKRLPEPSEELQTAVNLWGRLPRNEEFRTDFRDCNFTKVRFVSCDLSNAIFTSAKLDCAEFHKCNFGNCNFGGKKTTENSQAFHATEPASAYRAIFNECRWVSVHSVGCVYDGAIFIECYLDLSDFSGASFANTEFRDSSVKRCLFYLSFLDHVSIGPQSDGKKMLLKDNLVYLAELPEGWPSELDMTEKTPFFHDVAKKKWIAEFPND